jgi:hypothetical protein
MKLGTMFILSILVFAAIFVAFLAFSSEHRKSLSGIVTVSTWQKMSSPGELSKAHAFLDNNCAACHTPNKGVVATSCIACHANNRALLQRQPTAFHAGVQSCAECHVEHRGREADINPNRMDHAALAKIGLRQIAATASSNKISADTREQLVSWMRRFDNNGAETRRYVQISPSVTEGALPPGHSAVTPAEATLDCASCHSNKDPHRGLMGTDCVQCHRTSEWTIPEFRHPSPTSVSCAQCHQAPPSHYMMHFKVVCQAVARQPNAQVNQCYACHQTDDWNDIKGVGWYMHH